MIEESWRLCVFRYSLCVMGFMAAILLTKCAPRSPAMDMPRSISHAMAPSVDTPLGKALEKEVAAHSGRSGFYLITTGMEAFKMRLAMVQAAQASIDLQYYSTHDDTTGKLLLYAIAQAARRGVRVRMLLDDWNLDDFRKGALALNAVQNIEIRVFNPNAASELSFMGRLSGLFDGKSTRRMHNKAMIVDNQAAILGGRNLGDEYFDASKDMSFRDVDVLSVGPIAQQVSHSFDRYWASQESYPIEALGVPAFDKGEMDAMRAELRSHWDEVMHSRTGHALKDLSLAQQIAAREIPLIWARAELVADHPDKIAQPAEDSNSPPVERLEEVVSKAQQEFIIITPYLVPLDDGVKWLNGLVKKGVRVRVLTNSLASTDVVPAYAGYSHYRSEMVKGGVELYELKAAQPAPKMRGMFKSAAVNGLHAKVYMIDRKELLIGSFNLDPRSIRFNTELLLVIHSPELGEKVAQMFEKNIRPQSSYHLVEADKVPNAQLPLIPTSDLLWVTEEQGELTYYDFTPHAGFWRKLVGGTFSLLPIDEEL